ncbi:hypothetical protein [Pseudomonas sp. TTU2014-080ASC]|uniref:hypothetical protein n=1 Tax=Pseudomonas sp. TTU2014-080ASC TaxID=1729724 RepID=UPI000ADF9DA7|nr:hypothetical protein [Pseudomonas sp. TTU2014-080ASC]
MIKNFFLKLLVTQLSLLATLSAQAMSRYNDGDARVWIENNNLCLGVENTYKVGGVFLSRNAQVDENQLTLYGVSISRNDEGVVWENYSNSETKQGLTLNTSTCIPYGENIDNFATPTPAKNLEPGIYSILLRAGDSKGRRAWFSTTTCLKGSSNAWSVAPAKVNENAVGFARWYCE